MSTATVTSLLDAALGMLLSSRASSAVALRCLFIAEAAVRPRCRCWRGRNANLTAHIQRWYKVIGDCCTERELRVQRLEAAAEGAVVGAAVEAEVGADGAALLAEGGSTDINAAAVAAAASQAGVAAAAPYAPEGVDLAATEHDWRNNLNSKPSRGRAALPFADTLSSFLSEVESRWRVRFSREE